MPLRGIGVAVSRSVGMVVGLTPVTLGAIVKSKAIVKARLPKSLVRHSSSISKNGKRALKYQWAPPPNGEVGG